MIRKRIKKLRKKVPDTVVEKAVSIASPKPEEAMSLENVPQITNETIAEHREDVLGGARKYIYPLAHSKHRIIIITAALLALTVIAFLAYAWAGLYRFYHHNSFLYRVTQVVPFPIARVDGSFVNYENYLFELRRQIHYYEEQQGDAFNDFSAVEDREQLAEFRRQALTRVVNYAYVKQLADQNGIKVSGKEVDERIAQVREQNRLGTNDKVFADVLRDFWGWSIADFKRSLKEQILIEKTNAKLDTEATQKAEAALVQLKAGADFAEIAKQISQDPASAPAGGDYGFQITRGNPNIPPQAMTILFKLHPGQISGIVNTGKSLEILKVEKIENEAITARHIVFPLKDIQVYIDELKAKQPAKAYVKL